MSNPILPDPIEAGERCAEARYEEMAAGLEPGQLRCGCGWVGPEVAFEPSSFDPHSPPVCPVCAAGDRARWVRETLGLIGAVDTRPRIFREANEPPEGKYCLIWILDAGVWSVEQVSTLVPGHVYIPAPWLVDL